MGVALLLQLFCNKKMDVKVQQGEVLAEESDKPMSINHNLYNVTAFQCETATLLKFSCTPYLHSSTD